MQVIKRMVLLRKRPEITVAEFEAHWCGAHADLVQKLPKLRGFRVNLVESWTPQECAWDGIGEVWFDDVADVTSAYETEPLARALAEDRARFATTDGQVCLVREVTIVSPPDGP
jgi:uncharacterized protein (TIGR02118 family)